MAVQPIGPNVSGLATGLPKPVQKPDTAGFTDAINRGLQQVSKNEREADEVIGKVALGQAEIGDLMVATAKAQLSVDVLAQVRDRAIEAYQEIARMQV